MFYFACSYDGDFQKYHYRISAANLDEAIVKMKEIFKRNSHVKFRELLLFDVADVVKFDPETGEVLPSECTVIERKANEKDA
jgi:hypothetical protein